MLLITPKECCEIKQSIGELKQIFHQNENQLKNLKDQLQSLDLNEQKVSELTQTIKNLIQENKQNKDIEDAFKKKLKANDSELETLKTFILKTFEERVMLILRGEVTIFYYFSELNFSSAKRITTKTR